MARDPHTIHLDPSPFARVTALLRRRARPGFRRLMPIGPVRLVLVLSALTALVAASDGHAAAAGPDIQVVSVTAPPTVSPGQSFLVTAAFHNGGDAPMSPFWSYSFVLSFDDTVYEATDFVSATHLVVDTIAPGTGYSPPPMPAFFPDSVDGAPVAPGSYTLFLVADREGQMPESDETNNIASTTVTTGLPDLTLADLVVPVSRMAIAVNSVDVTATLKNEGTAPTSSGFAIQFTLSDNAVLGDGDDVLVSTAGHVEIVQPGQSVPKTFRISIPPSATAGAKTLFIKVDERSDVRELNEDDNVLSAPLTVLAPDLVPVSVNGLPAALAPGRSYAMSWTVENRGTTGVPGVQVGNSWDDTVYLSANATYESSDVPLRSAWQLVPFSASSYTSPSAPITISGSTVPGNYYLLVRVDINSEVFEGANAEGNNLLAHPIVIGRAPLASAGGPYTVAEGGTVQLGGTATDPDSGPISLAWDLDGNGSFEVSGGSAVFSAASIDGPATRSVTIRACDPQGLCATAGTTVTVENRDPSATLTGGSADEGTAVAIVFAAPTDPAPGDRASLRYAVACDGGSLDDATWESAQGSGATMTCTFDDGPTTATVHGKVMDDDGGSAEYTVDVAVRNVAPVATLSVPGSVDEGSAFTLALTSVADPSSADTTTGFRFAFDCGDGFGDWSDAAAVTCPTSDNGSRTVRARVQDKDGDVAEYAADVVIDNVAPTGVFAASPGTVEPGGVFGLSLSDVVDVSSTDVAAGFTVAFDCGSGYGLFGAAGTASCTAGPNPGVVTVRGQVQDKDGGVTEYSTELTVETVGPILAANVQQPIDRNGSSTFTAKRGVVPVKFTLTVDEFATCDLPGASIVVTRTSGQVVGTVNETVYSNPSDDGSAFRISDCKYVYNLDARSLGIGVYRVDIVIDGDVVGSATFELT